MTGGFKLGGIEISYFGIKLLEGSEIGMLPSTRDSIVTIAGKAGAYDFGAVMDVREFNLRCSIISDISNNDLRLKIREFVKHLVDVKGNPRTLELIFDNEPDKKYFVRYSGEIDFEEILKAGIFTLPLVAFDPFAYGRTQIIEQIIENNDEEIKTYSRGNIEAPAIITLENIGTNIINGFTIKYFDATENKMEFLNVINPNDFVLIDTKNMRVLLNGENALHLIGQDNFPNVIPGANKFIYSDDENERSIKITVRWEDRWL